MKDKSQKNKFQCISAVILVALACMSGSVYAAIKTETVEYSGDGIVMKGYLAYDAAKKGKRPGVLVVHEWWGHNEYARKRARMLADLGYTALAIDMYGSGKQAEHPDDAQKFSSEVKKNMDAAEARFMAAYKLLQKHNTTDPQKISAIGYCFGGGIVLEMARRGANLDGVVSFHGSLSTAQPTKKGAVKAQVLVLNGAADPFVKAEQIKQFKDEMNKAGVDYKFVSYPGAKHSFTNPEADGFGKKFGLPLAYNKKADTQSWKAMKEFLKKVSR